MRLFNSYREAHEALKIKGSYQRGTIGNPDEGITSLKLTENSKSLDRITDDFEIIYYVGIGKKSSQGEPAVNQRWEDQEPFYTSLRTQKPFSVLIKLKAGEVLYPGDYVVKSVRSRKSPTNISYYRIELHKVDKI